MWSFYVCPISQCNSTVKLTWSPLISSWVTRMRLSISSCCEINRLCLKGSGIPGAEAMSWLQIVSYPLWRASKNLAGGSSRVTWLNKHQDWISWTFNTLCLISAPVEGEDKFVPLLNQAPRQEDLEVSRGIAQRILNLGNSWRWVVSS
jgi:hypothetical protein